MAPNQTTESLCLYFCAGYILIPAQVICLCVFETMQNVEIKWQFASFISFISLSVLLSLGSDFFLACGLWISMQGETYACY
ncbi:hypothetical protein CJO09_07585 [Neopusillimonas maritima]|uniref:Uncharacterized protein n=1 Tax=Neopusillimonas maritima TaxID=2026239 RepID=A0ABX9MZH0_9BURK|nr:hypothetical protein [Pusillimonas sp.]RII83449.1 hypothetical protein CJO09_07585 [Neopusillimonas maritima]